MSEERIYVIVAETVQAGEGAPVVIQPAGRIAAQVGHAVEPLSGNTVFSDLPLWGENL